MSFSSSPFSLVGKEGKELFKEDYFIYLRKWKVSFSQPLLLDCCSHKPSWQRLSSDYPFIAESPNIHTWNLRFICKSGDDSPTHQRLFPCWKETQNVHGSVLEFYPFSVCVCVRTQRETENILKHNKANVTSVIFSKQKPTSNSRPICYTNCFF